jgi:hypothetical protein
MGGKQSKDSHEESFQYHDSTYQGSGSSYPEYSPRTPANIDAKKSLTREFSRISDNYNTVEQVMFVFNHSQNWPQIGHSFFWPEFHYPVSLFWLFNCQVTSALRNSGLESSNLIVGIDFTKSNEWTGVLLVSHCT